MAQLPLGGGIGAVGGDDRPWKPPEKDGPSDDGSRDGMGGKRRGGGSSDGEVASSRTLSLMIFTPLAAGFDDSRPSAVERCR